VGRLRDELADPWGPLVAGVIGGLAWAVGTPGLVAVGVGAAVYGVKAAVGALMGNPRTAAAPPLPAVGTPARHWLDRAAAAVGALDDMARGEAVTATDLATAHAAEEADAVLLAMRRLGAHVIAVTTALSRAEAPGLDDEAARLRQQAARSPDDESAARSAQAVADRVAVRDRLRKAQTALDGRLQSSALGLEGLVARVAEVRAAAAAVGQVDPTADDLAALTNEVEGLRVGLADVEQVAQRALRAGPVVGP
jgi:hypothetical protein